MKENFSKFINLVDSFNALCSINSAPRITYCFIGSFLRLEGLALDVFLFYNLLNNKCVGYNLCISNDNHGLCIDVFLI